MTRNEAISIAHGITITDGTTMLVYRSPIELGEQEGYENPWGYCPDRHSETIARFREREHDFLIHPGDDLPEPAAIFPGPWTVREAMTPATETCLRIDGINGRVIAELCGHGAYLTEEVRLTGKAIAALPYLIATLRRIVGGNTSAEIETAVADAARLLESLTGK